MKFKRYRDAVIVLVALAVPFWFLRYSMQREPRELTQELEAILELCELVVVV